MSKRSALARFQDFKKFISKHPLTFSIRVDVADPCRTGRRYGISYGTIDIHDRREGLWLLPNGTFCRITCKTETFPTKVPDMLREGAFGPGGAPLIWRDSMGYKEQYSQSKVKEDVAVLEIDFTILDKVLQDLSKK